MPKVKSLTMSQREDNTMVTNEELVSFLLSQLKEKDKQISRLSDIILQDIEIMKLDLEIIKSANDQICKLFIK